MAKLSQNGARFRGTNGKMIDFRTAWRPLFSTFGPNSAGFGGGEKMLRLRAYEKLQSLVRAGIVKKNGKEYRGDAAALRGFLETAAE